MKKMVVVLSLICMVGFGASLFANQECPKSDKECAKDKKVSKVEKHMAKADADKDGKVTVAEYAVFYKIDEAKATEKDKNGDGIISVEEFIIIAPAKCEKAKKKEKQQEKTEEKSE